MQSKIKTSETDPIQVPFLPKHYFGDNGNLGITLAPGKKQAYSMSGIWDRDLDTDLLRIKNHYKIDVIVCLLKEHEFKELKIVDQLKRAEELGMKTYHYPIYDGTAPDNQQKFKELVKTIVEVEIVKNKHNVLAHCMGGLGRAGTFGAASLIYRGVPFQQAVAEVKKIRSNRALTEYSQLAFLKQLKFD